MIEVKTEGFGELNKLLTQLPNNVEKRVLQSAVTSAVRVARKEIKKSAPRGAEISSVQKKYGYKKLNKSLRVIRLKRVDNNEKAARVDTGTENTSLLWVKFLGMRHCKGKILPKDMRNGHNRQVRYIICLYILSRILIQQEAISSQK